jgi:hypothetical protein
MPRPRGRHDTEHHEEQTMSPSRSDAPLPTAQAAATLADLVDTLRALRILARGARRRALKAARSGQRAAAARFAAHARLLARAAVAVQADLRRALALPVGA